MTLYKKYALFLLLAGGCFAHTHGTNQWLDSIKKLFNTSVKEDQAKKEHPEPSNIKDAQLLVNKALSRHNEMISLWSYEKFIEKSDAAIAMLNKLSPKQRETITKADNFYSLYTSENTPTMKNIRKNLYYLDDELTQIQGPFNLSTKLNKIKQAKDALLMALSTDEQTALDYQSHSIDEHLKFAARYYSYSAYAKDFILLRWLFKDKEYTPFGSTSFSQATVLRAATGTAIITAAIGAGYYLYKKWSKKKNKKSTDVKTT